MARRSQGRISKLFIAVHIVCVLAPLLIIVLWAFTSAWPWPELLPSAFSDRGIIELFSTQKDLGTIIAVSVGIALVVAVLTTVVAGLAARALTGYDFFGKEVLRFGTILPFLIPTAVFAMGIQVAFIQMGLANTIPGVIVAHMIVALPYAVMIMTDIMAAAGTKLEQQARVSGARVWQSYFYVQIPALLPGIISSMVMSYLLSFSQYFLTLLIGGGTVKTLATIMFPYLASGDRTIASAYGFLFFVITFGIFLFFELLLRRSMAKKTDYFNG